MLTRIALLAVWLTLFCGSGISYAQIPSQSTVRPAFPVYLFNSGPTREFYNAVGGNYDLILQPWRDYFASRGLTYTELQAGNLSPELKPGVLILPSAVALDTADSNAIQRFEQAGGSVLATWATGARNARAKWAGYDFLYTQFGIRVSGKVTRKETDNFLVIFGQTPVSHSLPAGTRIWFDQINTPPLRISGGSNVAGRFLDVLNTPEFHENEAIVYAETGASRRVYFAFSETLWQFGQQEVYTLVDDTLRWLSRQPDPFLATWPYPYRSAQIIEMDTETGFQNATRLANMLESNRLQGTFYCLTSLAAQHPDVLKHIEDNHELALHGDVHEGFKGQPASVQSQRLDAMGLEIAPLVSMPARIRGFRPPYELYDQTTEALLLKKGYGHLLVDSYGSKAMLPYPSATPTKNPQKNLIIIPRVARGDMEFTLKGASESDMFRAMNDDFDMTAEIGAVGVLSVHSENFGVGSPLSQATAAFLNRIRPSGNKAWIAPSGEIESWWRERARITFSYAPQTQRLEINIAKPGLTRKAAIVIPNPTRKSAPHVTASESGVPAVVTLNDYSTAIILNASAPGTYSYFLNYR